MLQKIIDEYVIFRNGLIEHPLFVLGTLLVLGYYVGKLVEKIKLPEITGFIIAGLILGNSGMGVVSPHMGHSLQVITEVALGFIALTIGGEFSLPKLKRMGKAVVLMSVLEILGAFSLVTTGLFLAGMDLPFAILMGAISSATAPAATVAIVQGLGARGKFIDYLYGIVALDDAGAVILYGIAFGIASAMIGSGSSISVVGTAFLSVGISVVVGFIVGMFVHYLTKKIRSSNETLIVTIGLLFLSISVSIKHGLSPLLVNMVAGSTIINLSRKNHRIFKNLERFSPPIYALFFVIAGTELQPSIIMNTSVLILGIIYILMRASGKYGGVYLACALTKTKPVIRKHLGFCLLPQAGVALGLVLLIEASPLRAALPPNQAVIVDNMVNIVLFSVFVNELIGPSFSRYGIVKGNEMGKK